MLDDSWWWYDLYMFPYSHGIYLPYNLGNRLEPYIEEDCSEPEPLKRHSLATLKINSNFDISFLPYLEQGMFVLTDTSLLDAKVEREWLEFASSLSEGLGQIRQIDNTTFSFVPNQVVYKTYETEEPKINRLKNS